MGKRLRKLRKLRIHREGVHILVISAFLMALLFAALYYIFETKVPFIVVTVICGLLYALMLNFFRCPIREFEENTEGVVIAPADGNWIPVDGRVKMVRHHKGNFHAAWLPKASIENERSTIVIVTPEGEEILTRQIAGAVARRVVTYLEEGMDYEIDDHMGFIKFGSRVDVYLPLGTKVCVKLGQKTTGNETIIARL